MPLAVKGKPNGLQAPATKKHLPYIASAGIWRADSVCLQALRHQLGHVLQIQTEPREKSPVAFTSIADFNNPFRMR